jgi:PKD repeat protein/dienelactone hydrolase
MAEEPTAIPSKPSGWGPYMIGNVDVQIHRHDTVDVAARIYYPGVTWTENATPIQTGAPWPTIVFIAGGYGTYQYCNGITGMMASHGFVVVNVELGNSYGGTLRDPYAMANETSDVLNYLVAQNSNVSFILDQIMDTNKFGVSGHSWGGAASGLAATTIYGDKRFKAAAPISSTPITSPTDYSKDIHIPLQLMAGNVGDNNLQSLFDAGNPPTTSIVVHGADHGGVLAYAEWPVAFFKYWLSGEKDYDHWVYTDGIRNDANITFKSKLYNAWGSVSASEIPEDSAVTFKAGTVGRTFGTVTYKWDLDGNGFYDWSSNTTNVTQMTYTKAAQMQLQLRAQDRYETKDLRFWLNVTNLPPVAAFSIDGDIVKITKAVEDQVLRFDAGPSNDTPTDRPTLEFKWDLGDGTVLAYPAVHAVDHSYPKAGTYMVNLWARDNDTAENLTINKVVVSNVPPTVKASPNIVSVEDMPVDLGGVGNDTPSDLAAGLSYRWDFGEGNDTDWSAAPTATYKYKFSGRYAATIFVKDIDGATSNDTEVVQVRNLPPGAAITSPSDGDVFQKDEEVSFIGNFDDTPSDIPELRTMWDLGDGTVVPWGSQVQVTHIYTKSGTYNISFSVKDLDGNVTTATITVFIQNAPPKATIIEPEKDLTVLEDTKVNLKAVGTDTASDQNGLVALWTVDGTNFMGFQKDITFTTSGVHEVLLTIKDPEGATGTASLNITVRNVVPKLDASVTHASVFTDEPINFTVMGNDTSSDQLLLDYSWDFGDGSPIYHGTEGTHTYNNSGTYSVTLEVKDDEGATVTKKFTVQVAEHQKPKPHDDGSGAVPVWALGAAGAGIVTALAIAALLLVKRRKGRAQEEKDEGPEDEER